MKPLKIDRESPSGICWEHSGKPAGTQRADGYWRVGSEKLYVHRIVWELINGVIPEGMIIDHKDRNPGNNLIENLRLATHTENMNNCKTRKDNPLGIRGVTYCEVNGYGYYAVSWMEGGRLRKKYFSVYKLGHEAALKLAEDFRHKKYN